MIKTIKNLLNKVKEQAVAVPGYKAKKILKVYIYLSNRNCFAYPISNFYFIL